MRFVALGMALISTPAAAADQFDLICKSAKETERYRVDLARGEWCLGDCRNVIKIASVTSGVIIFAEKKQQHPRDSWASNQVNRVTGEWRWYSFDPKYSRQQDIRGQCESAPFTGLPAAKF